MHFRKAETAAISHTTVPTTPTDAPLFCRPAAVRGREDPALQHPVGALRAHRLPPQVGVLQARGGHAVRGADHPGAWLEGLLQAAAGDLAWIQPVARSQGLQQR